MYVIGVTGPSGSGKGAVSAIISSLSSKKITVIDADAVYHDIITPPSECLDELVVCFGSDILDDNGYLSRFKLSKKVFGADNKEKLLLLNKITHKYIVKKIRQIVHELSDIGDPVCVIDAPLLIEAGLRDDCSLLISVLADKEVRVNRIAKRDTITEEAAIDRINSQKPDDFYIINSDAVIRNNGDLNALKRSVEDMLSERGVVL